MSKVVWTGKNLAEVKKLHKGVAHHPADPSGEPFHRDASQDANNLHLTTDEGHTIVVALGDTITKDEDGRISVQQTAKQRPQINPVTPASRVAAAEGRDAIKSRGRAK